MKLVEKWQKDLDVYKSTYSSFIIEGNIHDYHPLIHDDDESCEPVKLNLFLYRYLKEEGYDYIVFYNRVDHFFNVYSENDLIDFKSFVTKSEDDNSINSDAETIRRIMNNTDKPYAVIVDLANTMTSSPENLTEEEMDFYTQLMLSSKSSKQANSKIKNVMLTNLLFFITEKVGDIPVWFYVNNPFVRTLSVQRPGKEVRDIIIDTRIDTIPSGDMILASDREKVKNEFVSLTDGMRLVEILGIFSLCKNKNIVANNIRDAIKLFRYGENDSQWDKFDRNSIKTISEFLSSRIKGQEEAIRKTTEVISRACLGMSGIQGGSESRPKGILFLAGPTGTGKTELAKTIAEFIFGDKSFVTRFDMSEYGQPHSDQRLLGAPPGYVGYSEGGQLTNAIKNKPFCVLLFDEIDKAHPLILDKFLQILEDGRITDSSGTTVYFSESLIIFTSNLGIVKEDLDTGRRFQSINPDMSYEEIKKKLTDSIKDYFKYTIKRPELLNRIGDNFIIFDFIREEAAKAILKIKMDTVAEKLMSEKGIKLSFGDAFVSHIEEIALSDLSNGGRGIGNLVESGIINSLSKIIIEEDVKENSEIVIEDKAVSSLEAFKYRII